MRTKFDIYVLFDSCHILYCFLLNKVLQILVFSIHLVNHKWYIFHSINGAVRSCMTLRNSSRALQVCNLNLGIFLVLTLLLQLLLHWWGDLAQCYHVIQLPVMTSDWKRMNKSVVNNVHLKKNFNSANAGPKSGYKRSRAMLQACKSLLSLLKAENPMRVSFYMFTSKLPIDS